MREKKNMLIDKFGRKIDYLRLAVTDRCNLRCFYCMPEEGINYVPRKDLLSYEEMLRLSRILSQHGINKIRITGGEPFLRKDLIEFLRELSQINGISKIRITTNGILTLKYLDDLKNLGINTINLSLDTLDSERFLEITRRDKFHEVINCLNAMIAHNMQVKINCVVMEEKNIKDIILLTELTREKNISVRFIEEMPFNGIGGPTSGIKWNYITILEHIKDHFGDFTKLPDEPNTTSYNYIIPGFQGSFGVIPAFSRTICGQCNRIRITPKGLLKTCLYDQGVFNLRDFMRAGASDKEIINTIAEAVSSKSKDGFEAEKLRLPIHESMSTIGG
jgi:cyclic pyranopterin phosphate synthase